MAKPLSEWTDRELERSHERTWRKHLEYVKEQSRRRLIERYGADNPELDVYRLKLAIDAGTVLVHAKNLEEAKQIARDEIYCMIDNFDQIALDYGAGFAVKKVELGEETPAAE